MSTCHIFFRFLFYSFQELSSAICKSPIVAAAFWAKISIVVMNQYLIYIPLVSMLELWGKTRGPRRSNAFFCRSLNVGQFTCTFPPDTWFPFLFFPPSLFCSFMSNTYTGINNPGTCVLTSINIHERPSVHI